ncbi:MAG: hypothetical protein QOJ41_2155 [Acidobacteriaceae bacterium]|nr:hypothetical protein [Acidobacteriaceae bacterium]
MRWPGRMVYSIFFLPLLPAIVSAQANSAEWRPAAEEHSGCLEAPAPDAPPSMCVPALNKNENAADAIEVSAAVAKPAAKIDLVVPPGSTLRIALDQRTRISHPGDAVHGKVIETVYAFDQPVIPAGSIATGHVIKIDNVPAMRRTMAYANGDLTPFRKYEVTFDTVTLPDGRRLPVTTTVSGGTAEVVHLVSPSAQKQKSVSQRATDAGKQQVKGKIQEAKDQVHQSWEEVSAPGRMHRLKRYLLAQSPYRHQYIEPGTRFNADLDSAISFGEIQRTSDDFTALAGALPPNTTLKARLLGEVNSATATRGTRVEAVLTEPLYSQSHQLILPVNSRIVGQVVQAKAAHKFHHNGELRLIFERIEIPAEAERAASETAPKLVAENSVNEARTELTHRGNLRMTGNIEGVEVDRRDHMVLDEEGGARTTDSKTRYLSTGVAILLAAAASHTDAEHGTVDSAGDPGVRTAAGGSGFRLVGALISLGAKSQPVSIALGVYGASSSVYANFLSRGHEVIFPKDTPLEIGFGSRHSAGSQTKP